MYIYCCDLRSSKFNETRFKSRFGSQGKTFYALLYLNSYMMYELKQLNKSQIIPKGQSKMDNPQKLTTSRRKTKQKHNTICVGSYYKQTNTNNVNKT